MFLRTLYLHDHVEIVVQILRRADTFNRKHAQGLRICWRTSWFKPSQNGNVREYYGSFLAFPLYDSDVWCYLRLQSCFNDAHDVLFCVKHRLYCSLSRQKTVQNYHFKQLDEVDSFQAQWVVNHEGRLQGWLLKKGEKGVFGTAGGLLELTWKRRFFKQNLTQLEYYTDDTPTGKFKGSIDLPEIISIDDVDSPKNSFEVRIEGRTYLLRAGCVQDRDLWVAGLKRRCRRLGGDAHRTMWQEEKRGPPPQGVDGAASPTSPRRTWFTSFNNDIPLCF